MQFKPVLFRVNYNPSARAIQGGCTSFIASVLNGDLEVSAVEARLLGLGWQL